MNKLFLTLTLFFISVVSQGRTFQCKVNGISNLKMELACRQDKCQLINSSESLGLPEKIQLLAAGETRVWTAFDDKKHDIRVYVNSIPAKLENSSMASVWKASTSQALAWCQALK